MDNKTKFFKNVLLLQFIPILLLGILILSNFREQKVLKIRQLHPHEFNYGYTIPLFFFGIGLVLALFGLFSKKEPITQDETEILKIKRKKNFWKFAFYCNVFFIAVIAIFSVIISRENSIVIDNPSFFYCFIVLRALLVVVISLATASFFLAAGINWKTNKTLAVVSLIFSFFIIGASIFGDVFFMGKFHEASESYKMAKNEKRIPVQGEEQLGDYDGDDSYEESEEGDYEESEEVKEKEPLEIDKSRLTASLESTMDNLFVRKSGWGDDFTSVRSYLYSLLNTQTFESDFYLLNYMANLKDRPAELYAAFESYKSILYTTVSAETYRDNHLDTVVNGLLLVYEDVGTDSEQLNKIYRVMEMDPADSEQANIGGYWPGLEKYCSTYTLRELKRNKVFCSYDSDIVWFYSFWARRNRDGCAKEVALVLKEIKEHYN